MSQEISPEPRAAEVRASYLAFFEEREHAVVPSSPVFPQDDPTLLFTNAGMNQFKDVFLGTGTRDYRRAVDTQKCIRVSGKHNDLEEVGVDTYHHTFFEMLGNWSFGDYFKEEAIVWAWTLLTEVWKLPKERLWATVFGGDEQDGLAADEEAERIWREKTDIDPTHVLRFDKRDNFWEMGETGPCGPCSEIHIDRGEEGCDPTDGADLKIGVNAGNERFIELWNLVFMQFNRLDDGSLKELPAKSVDTGMGFERVLSVLQKKRSNYDTDLFTPIFAALSERTGKGYEAGDEEVDIAFRVCADHLRAVTSALSDGALPSNTGRGYVLRRLIRRAARYGRQALGMEEPFLADVVPAVVGVLGDAFPEMRQRAEHVQLIVREEEESFGRTLGRGLVRFEELAKRVRSGGANELPGAEAFELYATYGFPRDLVELMAREREMTVDTAGWEAAESAHQEASKSEGKFRQLLSAEELEGLESSSTYHDEGDAAHVLEARVTFGARRDDGTVVLVLDRSPFYAESGGQIGDAGTVAAVDGSFQVRVDDTKKVGGVVAHVGELVGGAPPASWAGTAVTARVDDERRWLTRKNHTATHLMHAALKEVLGDHVTQQGSYVGPDRLRFDFSHPRGVEPEELERIEQLVNDKVYRNLAVTTTVEDLEAAMERGVTALFGEKYDSRVRVLDVGGWSTELCGGTHVACGGGHRTVPDPLRARDLGRGAPHRGGHRARGRGGAAAPAAHPARVGPEPEDLSGRARRPHRSAPEAAQGGQEEAGRRFAGRRRQRAREDQGRPERAARGAHGRVRPARARPGSAARAREPREGSRSRSGPGALRPGRGARSVPGRLPGPGARARGQGGQPGQVDRRGARRRRGRQARSGPGPGALGRANRGGRRDPDQGDRGRPGRLIGPGARSRPAR